jgi:hypothetical protein
VCACVFNRLKKQSNIPLVGVWSHRPLAKGARPIGFRIKGLNKQVLVERSCVEQAQPSFGNDAELVMFL